MPAIAAASAFDGAGGGHRVAITGNKQTVPAGATLADGTINGISPFSTAAAPDRSRVIKNDRIGFYDYAVAARASATAAARACPVSARAAVASLDRARTIIGRIGIYHPAVRPAAATATAYSNGTVVAGAAIRRSGSTTGASNTYSASSTVSISTVTASRASTAAAACHVARTTICAGCTEAGRVTLTACTVYTSIRNPASIATTALWLLICYAGTAIIASRLSHRQFWR
ncbi:MAG: hypothetical protein FWG52_09510 [Proteobacteria bacterium]|nr:hypothetical protein [Pseudomonadota bacterium]